MPRVARFEVRLHRGVTAAPVGAARARADVRGAALLTLIDDAGHVGQGEAAPLPGHSVETLDEAAAALASVRELFLGRTLAAPMRHLLADRVRALPGSARFALETAVLDLVARRRAVPLRTLLSRAPAASVPGSAYVGAALDAGVEAAALAAARAGFATVKVKLTGAPDAYDRELDVLRALHRRLPRGVKLRLDVNGAWPAADAPRMLARLRGLGVELVEQPAPVGELRGLGRCAVPWAIDESLSDVGDTAAALWRGSGCVAAVVKPAVHGLLGGAAIAHRARLAGKGVVVTHFFDGPVGTAAACEFALAVGDARFAAGLAPHPGLSAWPAAEVHQLATPGAVTGTARPGHGVETITLEGP